MSTTISQYYKAPKEGNDNNIIQKNIGVGSIFTVKVEEKEEKNGVGRRRIIMKEVT